MSINVGTWDRASRVAIGAALIAFGLYDADRWRWLGLAGPVLVLTGLVRFCPAYRLLGVGTAAPAARHVA